MIVKTDCCRWITCSILLSTVDSLNNLILWQLSSYRIIIPFMILSYTNMRLLLVLIKQNYKKTGIAKFNLQKYRGFNMQRNEALQQEEGKVKIFLKIQKIIDPV